MSQPMASLPLEPAPLARGGGPTDPSHDVDLRRGILRTQIERPVAAAMVATFLLAIAAVPIGQAVLERRRDDQSPLLDLFRRAPTRDNLKQLEDDIEKASYAKEAVQPHMQEVLSRLGAGNKRAVVEGNGWLFYLPGVLSLAGPGFLAPPAQRLRIEAALADGETPPAPDPRPAILAFHRALKARGIRLVLVPLPDKAALQPLQLHGRVRSSGQPATNRDYPRWLSELRAAGVLVFEAGPAALRPDEPPRFLIQDTHWTPDYMQAVAEALAAFVRANVPLPAAPVPRLKQVQQAVTRVGDLVDMLKLPEGQRLFPPQTVTVTQVQDAAGAPWQPKADATVLLLGDSFTNVYSLAQMAWGESAGLGPHLARALGRDIDVLAQNDSGAFASRKLLAEALAGGEDRLAGKRVVIWEFASRELAVGDWRVYDEASFAPRSTR